MSNAKQADAPPAYLGPVLPRQQTDDGLFIFAITCLLDGEMVAVVAVDKSGVESATELPDIDQDDATIPEAYRRKTASKLMRSTRNKETAKIGGPPAYLASSFGDLVDVSFRVGVYASYWSRINSIESSFIDAYLSSEKAEAYFRIYRTDDDDLAPFAHLKAFVNRSFDRLLVEDELVSNSVGRVHIAVQWLGGRESSQENLRILNNAVTALGDGALHGKSEKIQLRYQCKLAEVNHGGLTSVWVSETSILHRLQEAKASTNNTAEGLEVGEDLRVFLEAGLANLSGQTDIKVATAATVVEGSPRVYVFDVDDHGEKVVKRKELAHDLEFVACGVANHNQQLDSCIASWLHKLTGNFSRAQLRELLDFVFLNASQADTRSSSSYTYAVVGTSGTTINEGGVFKAYGGRKDTPSR